MGEKKNKRSNHEIENRSALCHLHFLSHHFPIKQTPPPPTHTPIMSLQMSLVFCTMVGQMAILFILVLPLPHVIRQKIVDITFTIQKSQNFKVLVVFSFALMALQFMDCIKRLHRYSGYSDNPYFEGSVGSMVHHVAQPISLNYDQLASKFYAQRNLYLSGAILYLQMAIATVVTIVRKMVVKEAEYRKLISGASRGTTKEEDEEITRLKHAIELKQLDIDTLKKQIKGLQSAYDSLTPAPADLDKKSD